MTQRDLIEELNARLAFLHQEVFCLLFMASALLKAPGGFSGLGFRSPWLRGLGSRAYDEPPNPKSYRLAVPWCNRSSVSDSKLTCRSTRHNQKKHYVSCEGVLSRHVERSSLNLSRAVKLRMQRLRKTVLISPPAQKAAFSMSCAAEGSQLWPSSGFRI